MDIAHVFLLLLAGLVAGGINALAGGGSLITFPALIATGLPPIQANVTNSVAVFPGYVSSVLGSRVDLRGQWRRIGAVLPATALGAASGCALLLSTPARAFEVTVPFLVLASAATLYFQDRIRGLVGHPRALSPRRQSITLQVAVFAGAVYGGYFGAALGVMYVAVLALVVDESLNRINALKNVLTTTVGVVTVLTFGLSGTVDWLAVLVLAPATTIGGYGGALLARRLPARLLKGFIVAFGTIVGLVLLVRAFA
ncbi:sulfite exporter TauE/SafE family protein [Microbacterium sp. RD1]|uniref:sulfite exporter TauE/SafE family protein n=1 Tax=Microbacterium sp. RD1 TaxID=3457313 RepID=UPI003FA5830A